MTPSARDLLREALLLPLEDRADVAAELLASLDEEAVDDLATVEAEWAREIEERAKRAMAGDAVSSPWNDVRDAVARRLAND
jgi:hypothetical protein